MKRLLALLAMLLLCAVPAAAEAQPAAGPPGRMVRVNGIEMHYRETASGEPLDLLHGFGVCGEVWGSFEAALAERYRVIVPDLRGHGWSTNPENRYTHRQSAEDIRALLDALGLERVRAMGISSGGMTLLHLATRHPGRLERMVLIGATTHFPEQARRIMRRTRVEMLDPPTLAFFGECAHRGVAQRDALSGQFYGFKDSYEDMSFTAPHLATIGAPTLIVHGDRDEFFPVAIPVEMYNAIPRAELWIVPGGDHVPIYGPQAAEFIRIALRFLGEPAAAPATPPQD